MTHELKKTLEAMCILPVFRESLVPALLEMKQENLESLATDHEEKVTAFIRGRVSVLTELITLEDNLKKRNSEEALKAKSTSSPKLNASLIYLET